MVEARKMADQFDGIIPKEGVIVYRVQTSDPLGTHAESTRAARASHAGRRGQRSALAVGESHHDGHRRRCQVTSAIPGGYHVRIEDPSQLARAGQLLSYGDAGTPGNVSAR